MKTIKLIFYSNSQKLTAANDSKSDKLKHIFENSPNKFEINIKKTYGFELG